MAVRELRALPLQTGPAILQVALTALRSALDGSGPAVLPLPAEPAAASRLSAALRPDDPDAPLERDDIALVVATTGSTAEPKGALLPRSALLASARATHQRLGGPGDWLLALPLHHVAGLQVLVRALAAGTRVEAVDLADGFTPESFAEATARLRPRHPVEDRPGYRPGNDPQLHGPPRRYTSLVPTQLARLLEAGGDPLRALTTYDAVLVGGDALPAQLRRSAEVAGVPVTTTYGMTETCGGCVYDGQPLDGVHLRLDDHHRLLIRGEVLFAGYRLRPDLTAQTLHDGELRTADLARFDEAGRLEVLGRTGDVIVSGGTNVALAAIDAALAEHPHLRAAAAVGLADPEWGQRVGIVVVPRDGAPVPSLAELRAWVTTRLGRAAAPRELSVVPNLPTAGPGKVDRRAVRELLVPR